MILAGFLLTWDIHWFYQLCHKDSMGNSSCPEGDRPFYIGINLARKPVLCSALLSRSGHWQASVGIQTDGGLFILPNDTTLCSCACYSKHHYLLGFSDKNVSALVTVKQLNKYFFLEWQLFSACPGLWCNFQVAWTPRRSLPGAFSFLLWLLWSCGSLGKQGKSAFATGMWRLLCWLQSQIHFLKGI